jgi:transglutaminase-like putative cysteine protease
MQPDIWEEDGEELYLLEQGFRYAYLDPVSRLSHRLIAVPRVVHGGQCRLDYGLRVTGALASVSERSDPFGNHVVDLGASVVAEWIEFEVWALVRRWGRGGVTVVPPAAITDGRFLAATPLTRADGALTDAARHLSAVATSPMDLAERACTWTHQALTYRHDVTDVMTTAADAVVGGEGVCQDYAHTMLALCRAAGLPARYVSGHLSGEGGSHAWVEVVVNDETNAALARTVAVAFDPTHERRAERGYLTVAIGRDYADVAPTSGTFEGVGPGVLSARKRLELSHAGRRAVAS